jgi:hypothetical protein
MSVLTNYFTAAELDLYVDQGDDYDNVVTLNDELGEPLNLTGLTITASLKRYYNSSKDYSLTAATVGGGGEDGRVSLSITAVNTSLLIDPRYVYSVYVTTGTKKVKVLYGQVLISPKA